ncbi:unnamed protein product [Amoebophrya sp. A25]|nr:unnamed protein product [Amoebophrya sp. A25]|eukprot:GSA25T00022529001.1
MLRRWFFLACCTLAPVICFGSGISGSGIFKGRDTPISRYHFPERLCSSSDSTPSFVSTPAWGFTGYSDVPGSWSISGQEEVEGATPTPFPWKTSSAGTATHRHFVQQQDEPGPRQGDATHSSRAQDVDVLVPLPGVLGTKTNMHMENSCPSSTSQSSVWGVEMVVRLRPMPGGGTGGGDEQQAPIDPRTAAEVLSGSTAKLYLGSSSNLAPLHAHQRTGTTARLQQPILVLEDNSSRVFGGGRVSMEHQKTAAEDLDQKMPLFQRVDDPADAVDWWRKAKAWREFLKRQRSRRRRLRASRAGAQSQGVRRLVLSSDDESDGSARSELEEEALRQESARKKPRQGVTSVRLGTHSVELKWDAFDLSEEEKTKVSLQFRHVAPPFSVQHAASSPVDGFQRMESASRGRQADAVAAPAVPARRLLETGVFYGSQENPHNPGTMVEVFWRPLVDLLAGSGVYELRNAFYENALRSGADHVVVRKKEPALSSGWKSAAKIASAVIFLLVPNYTSEQDIGGPPSDNSEDSAISYQRLKFARALGARVRQIEESLSRSGGRSGGAEPWVLVHVLERPSFHSASRGPTMATAATLEAARAAVSTMAKVAGSRSLNLRHLEIAAAPDLFLDKTSSSGRAASEDNGPRREDDEEDFEQEERSSRGEVKTTDHFISPPAESDKQLLQSIASELRRTRLLGDASDEEAAHQEAETDLALKNNKDTTSRTASIPRGTRDKTGHNLLDAEHDQTSPREVPRFNLGEDTANGLGTVLRRRVGLAEQLHIKTTPDDAPPPAESAGRDALPVETQPIDAPFLPTSVPTPASAPTSGLSTPSPPSRALSLPLKISKNKFPSLGGQLKKSRENGSPTSTEESETDQATGTPGSRYSHATWIPLSKSPSLNSPMTAHARSASDFACDTKQQRKPEDKRRILERGRAATRPVPGKVPVALEVIRREALRVQPKRSVRLLSLLSLFLDREEERDAECDSGNAEVDARRAWGRFLNQLEADDEYSEADFFRILVDLISEKDLSVFATASPDSADLLQEAFSDSEDWSTESSSENQSGYAHTVSTVLFPGVGDPQGDSGDEHHHQIGTSEAGNSVRANGTAMNGGVLALRPRVHMDSTGLLVDAHPGSAVVESTHKQIATQLLHLVDHTLRVASCRDTDKAGGVKLPIKIAFSQPETATIEEEVMVEVSTLRNRPLGLK